MVVESNRILVKDPSLLLKGTEEFCSLGILRELQHKVDIHCIVVLKDDFLAFIGCILCKLLEPQTSAPYWKNLPLVIKLLDFIEDFFSELIVWFFAHPSTVEDSIKRLQLR